MSALNLKSNKEDVKDIQGTKYLKTLLHGFKLTLKKYHTFIPCFDNLEVCMRMTAGDYKSCHS